MKSVLRIFVLFIVLVFTVLTPFASRAVSESDLTGHSLYLHVKGYAAPFPGPGNYTIDFAATGHDYSIIATNAITAASGTWSFRQGDISGSVVITLGNYFGDGTGADIVLLSSQYYELYAGSANQNGNWSLIQFVQDPIFLRDLADLTALEKGTVSFAASLLNSSTGATYQWFKDGVAIAGSTNSFLSLVALDKSKEGFYSVRVIQGTDTNTSRMARLTVVPPTEATFNGKTFAMVYTNGAVPPGLTATDPTNAFHFKSLTQLSWKDGELTFLSDFTGSGTNKGKTSTGLFAVSNNVARKLVLLAEIMPGTTSPYLVLSSFNEPAAGKFVFYAVAKSSGGVLDYEIVQWSGTNAVAGLLAKTAIPGNTSQQFQFFGAPGGSGLDAAFPGRGTGGAVGYYQFTNGTVTALIDNNSILPGFPTAPSPVSLDVGYAPAGDSQKRLLTLREQYTGAIGAFIRNANGSFETVVDSNTVYPGTTNRLTQLGAATPVRAGGVNALVLLDTNNANYLVTSDAQGLHVIAKTGDAIGGGRTTIQNINHIGITDAGIVFEADTADGRTGVYLSHAGQITAVMDLLSSVGTNVVSSVQLKSASGTNVLLTVSLYPAGGVGYFVNIGPAPTVPLRLENGSHFDTNRHFSLSVAGLSGRTVVLEHSIDLHTWESVATNTLGSDHTPLLDPFLRDEQTNGFYRVRDSGM